MNARETLRAIADAMHTCAPGCCSAENEAALRALADRWDSLERDLADRQRALNNSVELGYLRINHGEGESQHREISLLRASLADLDAALQKEPR